MSSQTKHSSTPDVLVVGGGLIGCSIALRLAQARLAVCVIDRSDPGKEASSAAAGMLAPQGEMVEPGAFFQLCMESRGLYPSFAAEVEELSGEKVGYRGDGNLLVAINQEECQELENTYRAQSLVGPPVRGRSKKMRSRPLTGNPLRTLRFRRPLGG
jgi:glycine oxidase